MLNHFRMMENVKSLEMRPTKTIFIKQKNKLLQAIGGSTER